MKQGIKIKWKKTISFSSFMHIFETYGDVANPDDFTKYYSGEIIDTTTDFLGDTFLIVLCIDGKIRKCRSDKAEVFKI